MLLSLLAIATVFTAIAADTTKRESPDEEYGAPTGLPLGGPAAALKGAALAAPGSWTQRNALLSGSASVEANRMAGGDTSEAGWALMRAARGASGFPSSGGDWQRTWGGAPWQPGSGDRMFSAESELDIEGMSEDIGEAVAAEF